jgi:cyanophycin synthetase
VTQSVAPTPAPDLKIISSRVFRGPNIWHYEPAIQLVVDLGVLETSPPIHCLGSPTVWWSGCQA